MARAPTSLRERSKAKRRRAIQRTALRLFAERGYDGVTIAEIAEVAEVAPRTVSLYFPSKLDMAMSLSNQLASGLTTAFRDFPDLPFIELVDRWLHEAEATDPELATLTTSMFEMNPGLRAVSTGQIAQATNVGLPALEAEIGLATDDPMSTIIAAAAGAAVTAYLAATFRSGTSPDRHDRFIRYLDAIIHSPQRI